MHTQKISNSQSGFTLVQISVLLLVASLVMVAVLPTGQSKADAARITTERMNELMRYFRTYMVGHNGKLPCPADATTAMGNANYGVTAANGGASGNCSGGSPAANYVDAANHVAIGMVPYKSLGIPKEYAYDAWGRAITYAVDTNVTATCWSSPAAGTIVVTDNGTGTHTVIALVSHGANGHGAFIPLAGASGTATRFNNNSSDTDELTNAHVDASFSATSTLTNFVAKAPTSTFDDIVVYSSPLWHMNNSLGTSGITISSVGAATNYYYSYTNSIITIEVTYGDAVDVTGTPRIAFSPVQVGGGSISPATGYATYASGTGTNTLNFTYTVQSGDAAPNGLTPASPVDLNGGTLRKHGTSDNVCTSFTPSAIAGAIIPKMSYLTAGTTTYTIPVDWNSTYNKIEALGSGGNGAQGSSTTGGAGGGGGAYAAISSFSANANDSIDVQIGAGGGTTTTQFKDGSTLVADYGRSASSNIAAAGGITSNSVGTSKFNGGTGGFGAVNKGGGGGGGSAAGPDGLGNNGGNGVGIGSGGGGGGGASGYSAAAGGNGTGSHGKGGNSGAGAAGAGGQTGSAGSASASTSAGPAGTAGSGAGGAGSGGTGGNSVTTGAGGAGAIYTGSTWGTTYGPGGGGGGSGGANGTTSNSGNGGAGGSYGGGGGGSGGATSTRGSGGAGGSGLIVVTYR